ncbi:PTS sugar transporter subunit IIB [Anaerococcus vaginalis]|uniref:PTS sugar transporter subunit IIB n=1 Tax=Anaerococcus vaginalis TaxID=33037 RepID=UPI0029088FF8|nr:PTS sugar transporter subunit IIB [Anaerococcus vaginalis]MDU5372763.1 PTS sugar transporter subunit IIB [Anaerococcus vaginalis]
MNILVVCGAGLGSSFACQMSVESVLKELGVDAKVEHSDISSAAGTRVDILMLASNFRNQIDKYNLDTRVIYLDKLIDKKEIKEKLEPVLIEMGKL